MIQTKIRLEHVISFSDAIFAFSITFMAISIQIPNLPENLTQVQVIQTRRRMLYLLIFVIVGIVLVQTGIELVFEDL